MGQVKSIPEKTVSKPNTEIFVSATYQENRQHFDKIWDSLIDEWQNEEYPVWVLIFHPENEPRIFFSEEDLKSSIYYGENACTLKIPVKPPVNNLFKKFTEVIGEVVGEFVDVFTKFNEPPIQMTNDLDVMEFVEIPKPIPVKPEKQEEQSLNSEYEFIRDVKKDCSFTHDQSLKRDYEFIHNQSFGGVPISLAIVLDGKLIGVKDGETQDYQWFVKNPNHSEIQYNLLMS